MQGFHGVVQPPGIGLLVVHALNDGGDGLPALAVIQQGHPQVDGEHDENDSDYDPLNHGCCSRCVE